MLLAWTHLGSAEASFRHIHPKQMWVCATSDVKSSWPRQYCSPSPSNCMRWCFCSLHVVLHHWLGDRSICSLFHTYQANQLVRASGLGPACRNMCHHPQRLGRPGFLQHSIVPTLLRVVLAERFRPQPSLLRLVQLIHSLGHRVRVSGQPSPIVRK